METISGYTLDEEIYRSKNSIIWRGRVRADERSVVIKLLPEEFPPPKKIARFRREFEVTRRLAGSGIIETIDLVRHGNGLAMVLEDFGGESLQKLRATHELSLPQLLEVAVGVARALAHTHELKVMHKDINPGNIVWSPSTGTLKLIDFGIATELSRESASARNPSVIEGTLAYTSPEQTGRMNRPMDYRTDLYSLGATLYQLFAGVLVFDVDDPMELVHCHIARTPVPAHEANPDVPVMVSRIIGKLLEKSAEDRYQTAAGLAADLVECQRQLREGARIAEFEIARGDVSDRFQIPQKLYGRESEIAALLTSFDRVSEGAKEMMLVAGYSGVGKSALVHELHKPIVAKRGYFIAGKFDLLARNIPYASVIQAFKGLIQQLLTETSEQLATWKLRIAEAVGINGAVITKVIPEVELIIGEQAPVAELGPAESRNRFNMVFSAFVRTFCGAEHPLTLFLDDLQWADLPSLQLVRQLMTDQETTHLFLIGAYRDNEVDASHPLMTTVEDMGKANAQITTIALEPIAGRYVNQLIAEALKLDEYSVASLTGACMDKTQGNPFFLSQFLLALHEGGAIAFDVAAGKWTWDLGRIQAMEITDNVVDLMTRKITGLPDKTQHVLRLAACIGNRFDLKSLSIVNERSPLLTGKDLWAALSDGLVIPLDANYKFIDARLDENTDVSGPDNANVTYRFLHDRVQQAAYSLIADEDKAPLHGRVGRLMMANLGAPEREDQLFAIVGHLNLASGLLGDQDERDELTRLNLEAGRKGIGSAAYEPAADYLLAGIALLGDGAWERSYDVALALHEEAALALNMCARFDDMDRCADAVREHARSVLDRVKTYETLIAARVAQANLDLGIEHALDILAQLGQEFPEDPQPSDIEDSLAQIAAGIGDRTIEDLLDLPAAEDPAGIAAIRICAKTASIAYVGQPALFPLIVLRNVILSCEYGNTGASGYGYVTYAIFVVGALGDADSGYRLGQLGQRVIERYHAKDFEARTFYIPFCFLNWWKEHAYASFEAHKQVFQMGLETGDLEFSGWTLMKRTHQGFFIGRELTESDAEAGRYVNTLFQLGQDPQMRYTMETRQAIQNLMGLNDEPTKLKGAVFDEDVWIPRFNEGSEAFGLCNHNVLKVILGYLFEDYEVALRAAEDIEPWAGGMIALMHVPAFHFYDALTRLAVFEEAEPPRRAELMSTVDIAIAKFEKWADGCPANFLHKHQTLLGQKAAVLGELKQARKHFQIALRSAADNDYTHEEALAHELLGRVWLLEEEREIAGLFLTKARHRYELWGAVAKAKHLARKHEGLLRADIPMALGGVPTSTTTTGSTGAGALDLFTVMKASQAMSEVIVFERLIERIMRIVIESAGAERGVLLLTAGDEQRVAATADAGADPVVLGEGTGPDDVGAGAHSTAIVNYVARARDHVVLSNATKRGAYTGDEYILRRRPKSVLCTPLLHHGELTGVLYLENNLTTGAFTEQRLAILDLLLGQMAISMENAQLYERLEDLVKERTAQLEVRNRFIREAFGRYVSDEIVDSLLDDPTGLKLGGEKRIVTILMSDLRGFTAMSETLPPEKVVSVINNYLGVMTEVVMAHGGTIGEFIGDAILAIFGALVVRPDDAERAVACALAMQLAMDEVNSANTEQGLPSVQMGIGINTGEVVVGNIGSQKRAKYGVVGSNVNLAARIESYTVGGQVLVSETTLSQVTDIATVRAELRVQPKGAPAPITIYDIGGLSGSHQLRLVDEVAELSLLEVPLDVRYTVLRESDAVAELRAGRITALSETGAWLMTDEPLPQLSNLLLRELTLDGDSTPLDVYTKVVPRKSLAPGVYALHFTSVPAHAREVLARLVG